MSPVVISYSDELNPETHPVLASGLHAAFLKSLQQRGRESPAGKADTFRAASFLG
jgi:hypothetical protein